MWSPDGKKLVGSCLDKDRKHREIYAYWIETGRFEKIADFGRTAQWMSDSRRVLVTYQDTLYIANSRTKKLRELFSAAPHAVSGFRISDDDRMIYYHVGIKDADIWLATLE